MHDTDLDRLLAGARTTPLPASDDFMARMLADALVEQPRLAAAPVALAGRAPAMRRAGLWSIFSAAFGGAGVVAGIGCAAVLGLAVGYANPATLGWLTNGYLTTSDTGMELVPVAEVFLSEG